MKRNLSIRNKKGFTLVEVIAVLVILAILIAIVVPSVNTYIQKAKDREAQLTARNVYLAACVEAAEHYGTNATVAADDILEATRTTAGLPTDADITIVITNNAVTSITYGGVTYPAS